MGHRRRTRVALALWALSVGCVRTGGARPTDELGSRSAGRTRGNGRLSTRAPVTDGVTGRWAQASALLSPSDDPTLVVISGKTAVAGQTVDSAPSTSSSLSLNLSQPITDLANPPWSALDAVTAPIASYGSLVPLSSSGALFFGGDASSDPTVAVQTGNDSSWLLSLSPSSSSAAADALASSWTHEATALWPIQPQRRELAFTASATNGTLSRAWVYGGQRPDGSGTTFAELWELEAVVGRDGAVSGPRWAAWSGASSGEDAPPPMYDGTAVLVPSSKAGAMPSVVLVGGVQVERGTAALVDLSSVWAFTPPETLAGGSWTQLKIGGDAPSARRGHVAVEIGAGKVWVQGGRSLDGATVLSDAWVLDIRRRRWTEVSEGEQVWGHSAALVGETIVLAFGYGVNSPASTSLSVYAPGNDTWLETYYPSYATIISNPKAGHPPSSATATDADAPTESPTEDGSPAATATGDAADPAATDLEPASGDGKADSSPSGGDTPSSPQWTAPGSAGTSTANGGSKDPSDSGVSSDDSSGAPSKSTIAGAVVGSLLGALAVVVGAAFAVRRHRDNSGARYASAGFTGDDDFGRPRGGAGASSLMAEHRLNGGYASSEAYNLDKVLPVYHVSSSATAGAGVFGALMGLLSPRERFASGAGAAGRERRFDILKDEENDDAWDASAAGKEGWTRFDDEGEGERDGDAASTPLGGRGGMGIWEGFGGVTGGIDRLSDSLKSSSSYLGGALGGFIGATTSSSRRRRSGGGADDDDEDRFADSGVVAHAPQTHAYAAVVHPGAPTFADPALTPIAEWEEEDDDGRSEPDESRTLDTHSSGTHATGSTLPTSCEGVSPTKAAAVRIVRPFSPASSLYGSAFDSHQPLYAADPALTRTASGHSLASASNRLVQRSNSSWWSRLNLPKPSHGDVSTPTAAAAIRDPAPAPSVVDIAASDPFVDPPASLSAESAPPTAAAAIAPIRTPSYRVTRPDELGRFGESRHLVRGEHDASISSNATDVTATSSVLEERLRNMDVVERIRTGSAGDSSVEVTPILGGDGSSFGQLPSSSPENPFADAPARPQLAYTPAQDSVVWAGSLAGALSEVGGGARPTTPPPRVPSVPAILPPTPTYAPPDSPRKRLVGPRPQPMSPGGGGGSGRTTFGGAPTRSGSVKDLVASIEQRSAAPTLAAAPSAGAVARKRAKVEHGLAKKPLLYVANPDATTPGAVDVSWDDKSSQRLDGEPADRPVPGSLALVRVADPVSAPGESSQSPAPSAESSGHESEALDPWAWRKERGEGMLGWMDLRRYRSQCLQHVKASKLRLDELNVRWSMQRPSTWLVPGAPPLQLCEFLGDDNWLRIGISNHELDRVENCLVDSGLATADEVAAAWARFVRGGRRLRPFEGIKSVSLTDEVLQVHLQQLVMRNRAHRQARRAHARGARSTAALRPPVPPLPRTAPPSTPSSVIASRTAPEPAGVSLAVLVLDKSDGCASRAFEAGDPVGTSDDGPSGSTPVDAGALPPIVNAESTPSVPSLSTESDPAAASSEQARTTDDSPPVPPGASDWVKPPTMSVKTKRAFHDIVYEAEALAARHFELETMRRVYEHAQNHGGAAFLSIDVEFVGKPPQMSVIEVGWCSLEFLRSGKSGKVEPRRGAHAQHTVVRESMRKRNGRFLPDSRGNFAFGETVCLPRQAIYHTLAALISTLSAHQHVFVTFHDTNLDLPALDQLEFNTRHDWRTNLRDLGAATDEASHDEGGKVWIVDTQRLFAAWIHRRAQVRLEKACAELNVRVEPENLHNAANDAHYTLNLFERLMDRNVFPKPKSALVAEVDAVVHSSRKYRQRFAERV